MSDHINRAGTHDNDRDAEEPMTTSNTSDHVLTTIAELEALYPEPVYPPAKVKEADRITKAYQALVEASPFCAMATNGPEGLDCSPRGDPKGFVRVIDENTIADAGSPRQQPHRQPTQSY